MAVTFGEGEEESQRPLLPDAVNGFVDFKGRPAFRYSSGGWRSAGFIIGVEMAERFAYCGVLSNLITYLTGPLGESTAVAAANVNALSGTALVLPLFGAFVADSFLGRYRTIIVASAIYILALGLLTLSALIPSGCGTSNTLVSCSPQLQVILFFSALYLLALGQSGVKPCLQAFGADQFDVQDPEECKAKSSFFNWWYFSMSFGTSASYWVLNYIQDNLNWALGFGIPCIAMVIAFIIFLLGTQTYRFSVRGEERNPFAKISLVFVAAIKNWRTSPSTTTLDEEIWDTLPEQSSQQFRFLNEALLTPDGTTENLSVLCSISEVEEAKAVLRLIPIWTTSLVYAIVIAQPLTFFTKQGATMDRSITPEFQIPPATLQSFISFTAMVLIPIYDRVLVPIARGFTRKPSGITVLQRIGCGMLLSLASMVTAALVEMKRLRTAQEHGLVDSPDAIIPMSIWWLLPQNILIGISEVFIIVGLQEFFYDQVPSQLRSIGLSFYLSIFGVGNFLSSFLISVLEEDTGGDDQTSWFANNLNQAHLDYFYLLLASLSSISFASFLYFAKS